MMRSLIPTVVLLSLMTGCTQDAREKAFRGWCSSAPNCTVYDDKGRETSDRELCRGNRNCLSQ